uniref:hypothetical protein n=1 Tax=Nocardioides sp. TaxID=35761 RepID=UPI003562D87C
AWANQQPHVNALSAEEGVAPTCSIGSVNQVQASRLTAEHFPAPRVAVYRTIASDTLALVRQGDQTAAGLRITELETAWDTDESTLRPLDCAVWTFIDQQIDPALSAVRAPSPSQAQEEQALSALLATLG